MVGDVSRSFRNRASDCRNLAAQAGSEEWRNSLLSLAKDLEDEADKIDAEGDREAKP